MNELSIFTLKALRKMYAKAFPTQPLPKPDCEHDPNVVSQIIYDKLTSDKPCMLARFGSTELTCLINYIGIRNKKKEVLKYIKGEALPWWWDFKIINQMQQWSGFFPPQIDKIEEFCELMISNIPQIDILGSWLPNEKLFEKELTNVQKVNLELLNPFFSIVPWTKALEHKKILIIHPFVETIKQQYKKRTLIFNNNILPEFELKTIKAVQTIAGIKSNFANWFEALEYMKEKINETDFDICLIGAGAYGFPLAAQVKRMGKKGFHIGGSLQLLFGIRGKRWEGQYNEIYNYSQFFNEHWVKPAENEKPKGAEIVEGACYW